MSLYNKKVNSCYIEVSAQCVGIKLNRTNKKQKKWIDISRIADITHIAQHLCYSS